MPLAQYAKRVEAPVAVSAWSSAHCLDAAGRTSYDPDQHACVDERGHSGYEYTRTGAAPEDTQVLNRLDAIRQTSNAAALCKPWVAWDVKQQPLLGPGVLGPNRLPGPVGYQVCDPYHGQIARGEPEEANAQPRISYMCEREREYAGHPFEAMRSAPYESRGLGVDPRMGSGGTRIYEANAFDRGGDVEVRRLRSNGNSSRAIPIAIGVALLLAIAFGFLYTGQL